MRSLLALFTHNWKLKLSAFALAMLLWVTVTADQVAVRWLSVPVVVEVRDPDHRLLEGPTPQEVQVRISGPRREFWDLAINRPEIRLVLRDVREGNQSYALDPQQVQIPRRTARGLAPIDVRPARVDLTFHRVASVELPIEVPIAAAPPEGFALASPLQVEPGALRVTGPAERINRLSRVQTLPIDLSREQGEIVQTVPIDTTPLVGMEISQREVTVEGRIERAVQSVVVEVPVQSPAGVLIVPGAVDVHLWGAESVVRRLGPAGLRVVVPPESIPPQLDPTGVSVPVRVEQLPPGVRALPEPRIVRVLAAPDPPPVPQLRPPAGPPVPAPAPPDTVPGTAPGAPPEPQP